MRTWRCQAALEAASVGQDIGPFTDFSAGPVGAGQSRGTNRGMEETHAEPFDRHEMDAGQGCSAAVDAKPTLRSRLSGMDAVA